MTIDTLRADHLGSYGSRETKTPVLDRLAAGGLRFSRVVASIPETRPSHATIFSSLPPNDHGVLSNSEPLPTTLPMLPAQYARAGYATAGFASCTLFDKVAGSRLGFGYFDTSRGHQRAAHETVPAALAWLAKQPRNAPFFLWLHLFDPHMPYEPPGFLPPASHALAPEAPARFTWPLLLEAASRNNGDLPAPLLTRAKELYRGEVEHVDTWLGRFLDGLAAIDRAERTAVLVTADHGECFEKGVFFDHSHCLHEGALAVPMILSFPARVTPQVREEVVTHLDVAPTLLRLSGLRVPPAMLGVDLLATEGLPRIAAPRYAFFQQPLYHLADLKGRQEVLRRLRAVAGEATQPVIGDRLQMGARLNHHKYLWADPRESLYDLAADPAENLDLAGRELALLLRFRRVLAAWRREHPVKAANPGTLDPGLRRQLEALDYL